MSNEEKRYDAVIVGGGPAGYTAATYLARAGYRPLVIEKLFPGGQAASTARIDNYPGFDEGIDGIEFGERLRRGAHRFGAESVSASVKSLELSGDEKRIVTDGGVYSASVVIISTGAMPRKLGIANEEAFLGRGIHYCAVCDGGFYKDKVVAVVGGGNSAAEDALYLSELAERVILIHRRDSLRASKIYQKQIFEKENIEIKFENRVTALYGKNTLSEIELLDSSGNTERVALDGLFISIGRVPETALVSGQLLLDESGYIVADESTKTGVLGVFAAGDVRAKPLRQVVTAAADGAVAAYYAERYLAKRD